MIRVPWAMPLGIAYRDWLLNMARAEADAGCPRLLAMKNDMAMYFSDITEDWEPERRYHLICACIKRLCENNYGFAPIPWTEDERVAWSRWDYPWFGRDHGLGPYRSPGRPGAEFTWIGGKKSVVDADKVRSLQQWVRRERGEIRVDKKALRGAIKEAMKPTFGVPVVAGTGWSYVLHVEGLRLTTNLDFGGRKPSQLRYSQWIHQPKAAERDVWLLDHGGVGALLGWPQTEWNYLTDADIPEAANLLVQVCKEFIDAVPGMWARAGLTGAEGAPS